MNKNGIMLLKHNAVCAHMVNVFITLVLQRVVAFFHGIIARISDKVI